VACLFAWSDVMWPFSVGDLKDIVYKRSMHTHTDMGELKGIIRCQAYLRVDGGKFQRMLKHAISYITDTYD
jgi:hypothetical protein